MINILTSGLVDLGVIKNVLGANRLEEINGANTLDFQAVLDAKLQTLIEGDSIFKIDGAYFDTAFFKKTSNEDGTYTVDVEAEHVSYRLNQPVYNVDFFSEIGTPTYILGKILEGTGFTVGTVEFAAQTTYSAQEAKSRRQVLMEFVATLKGELSFHNFEISILVHRGSTEVKPALKGKNIKIVTKTLDKRNLDAEGNPTVSYTCEPLYLPEANYALGDEVMLMQKEIGVMEALRVVRISANPYDDAQVSYDFANYTNGLEDSIYRIMTQAVAKDALYNGVRIGPEYGFEAIRNDKRARAYFRSDGFVMQSGDGSGEGWRDRLYFDPLAGVYMFDGMLSADMITALEAQFDVTISNTMITNTLTAGSANIAQLTVDQLDTSDKVQNYLASNQADVNYIRAFDQIIEFVTATRTGATGTSPVYDRFNNQLYWLDDTFEGVGLTVTAYPVTVYNYIEQVKMKIEFVDVGGTYTPIMTFGVGTGIGNRLKGQIYKDGASFKFMFTKNDDSVLALSISDSGVEVLGNTGTNGLRNIYIGATPATPQHNDLRIVTV